MEENCPSLEEPEKLNQNYHLTTQETGTQTLESGTAQETGTQTLESGTTQETGTHTLESGTTHETGTQTLESGTTCSKCGDVVHPDQLQPPKQGGTAGINP